MTTLTPQQLHDELQRLGNHAFDIQQALPAVWQSIGQRVARELTGCIRDLASTACAAVKDSHRDEVDMDAVRGWHSDSYVSRFAEPQVVELVPDEHINLSMPPHIAAGLRPETTRHATELVG